MNQDKKSAPTDNQFPENFPTSARPVFRAVVVLAVLVAVICYVTYACSDHPDPATQTEQGPELKREDIQKGAEFRIDEEALPDSGDE